MFQKQAKANKSKKDLSASCFIVEMNQNERHKFGLMKLCLSLCWESSYIAPSTHLEVRPSRTPSSSEVDKVQAVCNICAAPQTVLLNSGLPEFVLINYWHSDGVCPWCTGLHLQVSCVVFMSCLQN